MKNMKFTITDKIVADSLDSIGLYSPDYGYKLAVNGGIATQLYIIPHFPYLVRPTHDVDLLVNPRLNSETFRDKVGEKLAKELQSYNPLVEVLRHVYQVKLEDSEKTPFFIHSYRWTVNGFDRNRKDIEREVSNANQVKIPNSDNSVYVVRPEDLVAGKVSRLEKIKEKNLFPKDSEHIYQKIKERDWADLGDCDLGECLSSVVKYKAVLPAYFDGGEDEFKKASDKYVSSKDLYDISLIAKLLSSGNLEFDEKYYDGILQDRE